MAPTFRSYDAHKKRPAAIWQTKSSSILCARLCRLSLASLQVRGVFPGVALPEVCRLGPVVMWGERLLILPDTADTRVILKVAPDTRQVVHHRYSQAFKPNPVPNPRQHQRFGCVYRAQKEHHFKSSSNGLDLSVIKDFYPRGSLAF